MSGTTETTKRVLTPRVSDAPAMWPIQQHLWKQPPAVVVYGTDGCSLTMLIRRYLDRLGVSYSFVDVEDHPDALPRMPHTDRSQAGSHGAWGVGGRPSPLVYVANQVFVEPSLGELDAALVAAGLHPEDAVYLLPVGAEAAEPDGRAVAAE